MRDIDESLDAYRYAFVAYPHSGASNALLQAAANMERRLLWLVREGSWDGVAWERVGGGGATLG